MRTTLAGLPGACIGVDRRSAPQPGGLPPPHRPSPAAPGFRRPAGPPPSGAGRARPRGERALLPCRCCRRGGTGSGAARGLGAQSASGGGTTGIRLDATTAAGWHGRLCSGYACAPRGRAAPCRSAAHALRTRLARGAGFWRCRCAEARPPACGAAPRRSSRRGWRAASTRLAAAATGAALRGGRGRTGGAGVSHHAGAHARARCLAGGRYVRAPSAGELAGCGRPGAQQRAALRPCGACPQPSPARRRRALACHSPAQRLRLLPSACRGLQQTAPPRPGGSSCCSRSWRRAPGSTPTTTE